MSRFIASDLADQTLLDGENGSLSCEALLEGQRDSFRTILRVIEGYNDALYSYIQRTQQGKADAVQSEEILKVRRIRRILMDLNEAWGVLLEKSSSSSILGVTRRKLNRTDVRVLTAHLETAEKVLVHMKDWCPEPVVAKVERGRAEFIQTMQKSNASEKVAEEKAEKVDLSLSQRIAATAMQEYKISSLWLWLRRLAWLLSAIIVAGLTITVIAVLTSQGLAPFDPSMIGGSIVTAFTSFGAIFGGPIPVMSSTISFGGELITLTSPAPITVMQPLSVIVNPFMLRRFLAKFTVQPPREMAAINAQVASVYLLAEELFTKLKNTKFGDQNNSVFARVKSDIERAKFLYREGVSCTLESSRRNRITKARLILFAVAKVMEENPGAIRSLQALLNFEVKNSGNKYSYGEILNVDRSSLWRKEKTVSVSSIKIKGPLNVPVPLTFGGKFHVDEIAQGLAMAATVA